MSQSMASVSVCMWLWFNLVLLSFGWAGLYHFQSGTSSRWTEWLSPVAFCTGQGLRLRRSSQLPTRLLYPFESLLPRRLGRRHELPRFCT